VWCIVVQFVAVCCSVLQCVAVLYTCEELVVEQCNTLCCSVLQYVAVCYSMLQCVAVLYTCEELVAKQCVTVCCSVLQCCILVKNLW